MSSPTVVFICQGNICRSPFAEEVLRILLPELQVSSAGLGALKGYPAPGTAISVAAALGFDTTKHRGRQLTDSIMQSSDIVVAMSDLQLETIEEDFGSRPGQRLLNLAKFVPGPLGPNYIPDPFRQGEYAYQACFALILDGVKGLAKALSA